MDLKLMCVFVGFYVLTITSTEAGIPKCCVRTKKYIPQSLLLNVQRWEKQTVFSACNIDAVVLYIRALKKPICAPPEIENILKKILRKLERSRSRPKY